MAEKILLVDGHSIANRAFFGVPLLTNSKGQYTNALFGFFNILFSTMEQVRPDRIAVAFDLPHPTFRHDAYPEYKGNRAPMQEELREQIPVLKEMLEKAGVQLLMLEGYEADDLLGTAARRGGEQGQEVTILSGDRDLLQLVNESVTMRLPKTKKNGTEYEIYHPEQVQEHYGVTPLGYLQMKGLMGDSSDNIPGVPKIGEKTASKIIQTYGSIENAIEHAAEVKPPMAGKNLAEFSEQARMSLMLSTIITDVPGVPEPSEIGANTFHTEAFIEELKKYELKSLLRKILLSRTAVSKSEISALNSVKDSGGTLSGSDTPDAGLQAEEEGSGFPQQLFPEEAEECPFAETEKVGMSRWNTENGEILSSMKELGKVLRESMEKNGLPAAAIAFLKDADGEEILGAAVNRYYAEGSIDDFLREMMPVLENEETEKIFCDAKPLYRSVLKQGGTIRGRVLDEMIAAYLLNATSGHYTPDVIASAYLDRMIASEEELTGSGARKLSWTMIEDDRKAKYLLDVTKTLYDAAPLIRQKLTETGMLSLYEDIEGPLVEVLASMENEGIRIDPVELDTIGKFLRKEISRLQSEIFDLAGYEFNINSTKQLGKLLFEDLKLPAGKKTKSGYSTSAEVLEGLRMVPVVEKVLEYRQLSKLESTYVEGLVPCIAQDGCIHCRFQQAVTATGRLSCTDPNLQNIPIRESLGRELRKAFVPKDRDHFFMDADYSQIELRLVAHMSGDPAMIQAYRTGADIHRLTASEVLHIPYEEINSQQRSSAKAVNFGIIYGMSAFSLANDLGMSNKEAATYISDYFARFPGVKAFLDECVAKAKETGYGVTIFGRRRQIDELKAKNFAQRSFGERVAKNMPIQGSAADIIKIAMVRVYRRLQKEGLKSRLILQVHDELMIEVYRPEEEAVAAILKEEMQGAAELLVPLTVEVASGENWYESK